MKKIALLTALTVILGTSSAFAICNCPNPNPYAYDMNRVSIARPVVVVPAVQNPCCNPCCGEKRPRKNLSSHVFMTGQEPFTRTLSAISLHQWASNFIIHPTAPRFWGAFLSDFVQFCPVSCVINYFSACEVIYINFIKGFS